MSPSTPSKTLDSSVLDSSTSWINDSLVDDDSGVNSSLWLGGYSTPPGVWKTTGGKSSGKENTSVWGTGMESPVVGGVKRKCAASKRIAFSPLKVFAQQEQQQVRYYSHLLIN